MGLVGNKKRCGICQDGRCEYVMKVLWKILCISCFTVERLLIRGRLWVGLKALGELKYGWQNGKSKVKTGVLLGRSVAGVKEKELVRINRVVYGRCVMVRGGNIRGLDLGPPISMVSLSHTSPSSIGSSLGQIHNCNH